MRALNGRVIPGFYGSRAGAEMSDIGVAEIPVDEEELPPEIVTHPATWAG